LTTHPAARTLVGVGRVDQSGSTWDAVLAIEAELVHFDVEFERLHAARERVRAGGVSGFFTRVLDGTVAQLDQKLDATLGVISANEERRDAAEAAWRSHLDDPDPLRAHQLRAIQHALRLLKAVEADHRAMTPEDIAWIRRALRRVHTLCEGLEGTERLAEVLSGVERARLEAKAIRPLQRQLARQRITGEGHDPRAEAREDVALVRAAEPLLQMQRQLTE
jgi:hypothetical protein